MLAHGESVLVVDDDEGLAQVIALTLRAEGFEVSTAHDGVDGYRTYFRHPTDWVVTDIQMPELDGLGMMQCIRAINPGVKTVYISGAVDHYRARLKRETEQFAANVLPKPFSRRRLIEQMTGGAQIRYPGSQ